MVEKLSLECELEVGLAKNDNDRIRIIIHNLVVFEHRYATDRQSKASLCYTTARLCERLGEIDLAVSYYRKMIGWEDEFE